MFYLFKYILYTHMLSIFIYSVKYIYILIFVYLHILHYYIALLIRCLLHFIVLYFCAMTINVNLNLNIFH